jgi:CRISPR/Cas system CSM-associated protein Csm2 small subunit
MSYNDRNRNYADRPYDQRSQTNYTATTEYYDANGRLKKEVFIEWPKQIADSIRVSRTNMRRAYDCVSAMRLRIQARQEDPQKVVQEGMGQLHRFAQYQAARDDKNWSEAKNFFHAHCNAVGSNVEKFEGFYQLFQSTMAYLRTK